MKTITEKVITDILDKMGISYNIIKPRTGSFGYKDTMFMIKDKTNLLYLTNFDLKVDTTTYEISYGDLFYLTPCGTLSGDWVKIKETELIKNEFNDVFIITTNDDFEFTDFDDEIREYMGLTDNVSTDNSDVLVETNGRPLSEFLKTKLKVL